MAKIDIDFNALKNVISEGTGIANDSLRVVTAIQNQIEKVEYDIKKDSILTQQYINQNNQKLVDNALSITELKDEHNRIGAEQGSLKFTIEPFTFDEHLYTSDLKFNTSSSYQFGSDEYVYNNKLKFSNSGGTYTLDEAQQIINDLDSKILLLHKGILSKQEKAHKNGLTYYAPGKGGMFSLSDDNELDMILGGDNYPKLFDYYVKTPQKNGNDKYKRAFANYEVGANLEDIALARSVEFSDNPDNSIFDKETLSSINAGVIYSNIYEVDNPLYHEDRLLDVHNKIYSVPWNGLDDSRTDFLRTGWGDKYDEKYEAQPWSWTELFGEGTYEDPRVDISPRGEKTVTRTAALEHFAGQVVNDMVDIQWLLLQRHKILCSTEGGDYCIDVRDETGRSSERDTNLLATIKNFDVDKLEIENNLRELDSDFEGLSNTMSSNLGFSNPGNNLSPEDLNEQHLKILNLAIQDLQTEAKNIDNLYITEDMDAFIKDLKNNPKQLLKLFNDLVKKSEDK